MRFENCACEPPPIDDCLASARIPSRIPALHWIVFPSDLDEGIAMTAEEVKR
jgi:hypothetical protein